MRIGKGHLIRAGLSDGRDRHQAEILAGVLLEQWSFAIEESCSEVRVLRRYAKDLALLYMFLSEYAGTDTN
jgi:hypothetical protein